MEKDDQIEQLKEILLFLVSNKPEARHQALDIILSYTAAAEHRRLFRATNVCKELLRVLPEPDPKGKVKILKCLINLSLDEFYIGELCTLNVAPRLYDLLKQNVKQDLTNSLVEADGSAALKMNLGEGLFELRKTRERVDPDTGKVLEEDLTETIIQSTFMLMSNLTATAVGQKHILGLEDASKSKYIIAESIFGMMCYFSQNTSFDFVCNIMANLACLEEGRLWMINNKYIEAIIVQMVTKVLSTHRRKYLMFCIRNMLFEYEKY